MLATPTAENASESVPLNCSSNEFTNFHCASEGGTVDSEVNWSSTPFICSPVI
jgi:hypothetical protein